jgi:hypothetical protein
MVSHALLLTASVVTSRTSTSPPSPPNVSQIMCQVSPTAAHTDHSVRPFMTLSLPTPTFTFPLLSIHGTRVRPPGRSAGAPFTGPSALHSQVHPPTPDEGSLAGVGVSCFRSPDPCDAPKRHLIEGVSGFPLKAQHKPPLNPQESCAAARLGVPIT